jgi:hypothetical protein
MSDRYDRIYGQLHDLAPMSRPATIIEALPNAGIVATWVVQVAIHDDRPVAFVQAIDAEGQIRLVLPSRVVSAVIRQEEALRKRINDRRSEERKRADADKARVAAAKALLEKKREERRARRNGEAAS